VDAKQRELIGNFKNPGRTYRRKRLDVLESDYPSDADGVAIPYGIYDTAHNAGFVVVGVSHQTPEFAVSSIRRWWCRVGKKKFPNKKHLLVQADCGGGSWARLGSDGVWVNLLEHAGVTVEALKPSNCGFDVAWSPHFRDRFEGQPLKSVVLTFGTFRQQGEFIVTKNGVQGNLIYAASAQIRDEIEAHGKAVIGLDMLPEKTEAQVLEKLSKPRGSRTMASHLEKTVNIKGVKAGLLREFVSKEDFANMERLAASIKHLQIPLIATRPLDEAISSAGGVTFESLDENLMIRELSGFFCAGEMLDWEAPTGGYLLTACFASGRAAGEGVLKWMGNLETAV
jgi:uncharacterized flavoprotein (TIGR03862 family)